MQINKRFKKSELMHAVFGTVPGRCKDCDNLVCYTRDRNYYKCSVYGISSSETTDWKISSQACGMKDKEYNGNPVYKSVDRFKEDKQIQGQLSFADMFTCQ